MVDGQPGSARHDPEPGAAARQDRPTGAGEAMGCIEQKPIFKAFDATLRIAKN